MQDNSAHRHPNEPIDVRGTIHGVAIDVISAADARWFEDNPGEMVRHRAARDHEFCDPACYPACILAFEPPQPVRGVQAELRVQVRQIVPGVRFRMPYWVLVPERAA